MNEFVVPEEYEGERVDSFLAAINDDLSRSLIQKLIKDEKVIVNGKSVKPSYKVCTEDAVGIDIPDSIIPDILPENIPLDVLYEDNDVILVNKPKGMVVHPAAGHYSGTLVNALMYHCKDSLSGINGVLRPGIVHRIDMNTTGVLICCKNDNAHRNIAEQIKAHSVTRRYYALCHGSFDRPEGVINVPIGRNPKDRKKMAAGSGKEAVTHYRVLESFKGYSFIECRLETGRTHQIRVHMASIGHAVVGDDVYGTSKKEKWDTNGQMLHAYIFGFIHPVSGEYIEVTAPLPAYFENILKELRNK